MKVSEIVNELGLTILVGAEGLGRDVKGGYVSDLLSDVMGNADEGFIWITLQTHKNVMAIASLKDLAAVILVSGHRPDADMAAQAQEEGIPVLSTNLPTFEVAGRLYCILK